MLSNSPLLQFRCCAANNNPNNKIYDHACIYSSLLDTENNQKTTFTVDHITTTLPRRCNRVLLWADTGHKIHTTSYIAIFYSVSDYDAILATAFPSPVEAVYQQATGRSGVALVLLLFLLSSQLLCLFTYISASIRLLYGFSRDGSFTHGKWWCKIDAKHNIPINVLYIITVVNFVLGFVYWASELGFQILLRSANCLYSECLFSAFLFFRVIGNA